MRLPHSYCWTVSNLHAFRRALHRLRLPLYGIPLQQQLANNLSTGILLSIRFAQLWTDRLGKKKAYHLSWRIVCITFVYVWQCLTATPG